MTYDELLLLKDKQNQRYKEWKEALVLAASDLRTMVDKLLEPPVISDDKAEAAGEGEEVRSGRYVEIVNIAGDDQVQSDKPVGPQITEEGTLIFGISVGFSRLENGAVGDYYFVPVAIRFIKEKLYYQIHITEEIEADQWTDDLEVFCSLIFEEFAAGFRFDPFEGPKKKRQIGFLKNFEV